MVYFHFSTSKHYISSIIRYFTWSIVSHVAIEIDGFIFEAEKEGVRLVPNHRWDKWQEVLHTVEFTAIDSSVIKTRLLDNLHKEFDYSSIWRYLFKSKKVSNKYINCTRLAADAIQEVIIVPHHKLSPRNLLSIVSAISLARGTKPISSSDSF